MSRKGYRPPEGIGTRMVESIIEAYGTDGAIRALAQEPVQNAKDAGLPGEAVHVEFRLIHRLHQGKSCQLLTVTDRGTTGLSGEMNVTPERLKQMNQDETRQLKWFYFERIFDSNKSSRDIGARGQGKSAFLYHSRIPGDGPRMMMLYDTMLLNGEYRFNEIVVYENFYGISEQPFLNEEAKLKLRKNTYENIGGDIQVPLGLQPLNEPGTRIIVPWLSDEAAKLIRDGTLYRWVQHLWWYAIVKGELRITIVDELGIETNVVEPEWWEGEFWSGETTPLKKTHRFNGFSIKVHEDEPLESDLAVRRFVIYHEDKLREEGVNKDTPEYCGVQIIRNGQCIETYWSDDFPIPKNEKYGIRAFIELDEETEMQLRDVEKPQHDGFDWRKKPLPQIKGYLVSRMVEFAEEMGWQDEIIHKEESEDPLDIKLDDLIAETFFAPSGGTGKGKKGVYWECRLNITYPNPETTRVEFGNLLRNVNVKILCKPSPSRSDKTYLILDWENPSSEVTELYNRPFSVTEEYRRQFSDWLIGSVDPQANHLNCPEPGTYIMRASIEVNGHRVKKTERAVYVECDPPIRKDITKEITLAISLEDSSRLTQKRINEREKLWVNIHARNHTPFVDNCFLTVLLRERLGSSLHDRILLEGQHVDLPGTLLGNRPVPEPIYNTQLSFVLRSQTNSRNASSLNQFPLDPGRHTIHAYLTQGPSPDTKNIAAAENHFYFEDVPPGGVNPSLPFRVQDYLDREPFEKKYKPSWELDDAGELLIYPSNYPIMHELCQISEQEGVMKGSQVFRTEVILNGILEWALRPSLTSPSDESRVQDLKDTISNKVSFENEMKQEFDELLDGLFQGKSDRMLYASIWRKAVAIMWVIVRKASG